ncbi:10158_t:CDS:2, partial [Funneliformis mosseae]
MAHDYYYKDKFRLNAKPKTSKLILTEKQRNQLNYLFTISDSPGNEIFTTEIWNESAEDQKNAKEFIIFQAIPVDLVDPTNSANRDPANRWKIRWSDKKNGATLYQCSCGSDMQAASKTPVQKQRPVRQLYEFNGCLAFVRLEIDVDKKVFKRVHGYLVHSEACHRALPKKNAPKISINCDIRDMTELLIRTNASTNDILSLNQQLVIYQLGGRLILRNDLKGKDEHFVITAFDVKDARRWIKSNHQPQWDFDADRSVEHNLRELFGPNSSDMDLRDATIHYKPRDNRYDYTLLILATEEQRLQAWKYGHQKYIVLDGTFQTGSRKLQMYVIMVIDEYKRGVPIGYLLFSRPCHTDLMVVSNHEYGILRHLLETYKNVLSQEAGESFAPKVAIIDFGFKERLACSEVWPYIHLVFSPSQVHQCWTNKIDQLLVNVGDHELTRNRTEMKKFLNDMIA